MPGLDEPIDARVGKALSEGSDRRKSMHQVAHGAQADDQDARSHADEVSVRGGAESRSTSYEKKAYINRTPKAVRTTPAIRSPTASGADIR